ncbi:MAG: DUF4340 domain-containing protein [Planctomycetes bacterium]|nr:DUF4340 domain-containing protein [Planctomycetota bacterium]
MRQTTHTIAFIAAAAVLAGVAIATHLASQPAPLAGFEKVGTEFFKDFDDPNAAKQLEVVAFNEDEATISDFQIVFEDGLWRIPSHHGYPADAKEQLAKTATGIIGLEREGLASRRESDYERFGVLDPEIDDRTKLKGRGKRLTLRNEKGDVLADFIIGKEVEDRDGYFYVRRPDEKETYFAKLDLDLSTKFSQWIDQDLLQMDRWDVVKLAMIKPDVSSDGRIVDKEKVELTRKTTSDPWKLEGLDEDSEQVKRTAVDDVLQDLDNLEIVGVRPKPRGITADFRLEIPPNLASNPQLVQVFQERLLVDLERRGFQIGGDEQGQPRIFSPEGEVIAATNDGVAYHLHFGDLFTGSIEEIEIGSSDEKDGKDAKDGDAKDGDAESDAKDAEEPAKSDAEGETADEAADSTSEDKDSEGVNLHRYLFVRAAFDASLLPAEPVKPEEPEKPEGLVEESKPAEEPKEQPGEAKNGESPADAAKEEGAKDEAPTDDNPEASPAPQDESAEDDSEDEAADEQPAAENADAEQPPKAEQTPDKDPQAELRKQYEAAKRKYEQDLADYQRKLDEYQEDVKAGQEKVEELNRRFGKWYYVVSGASFENLKFSRSDVVEPKKAEESPTSPGTTQPPPSDDAPVEAPIPPTAEAAAAPAEAGN